jgi:c-di-GMP-binding flagellar brake protein YcgR
MNKTNDSLPLEIGQRWELSLTGIRCIGEVRGWKQNKQILLELPSDPDGYPHVVQDSGCKAKYHFDGFFISFSSTVLAVQREIPLLVIQYPAVFNKYGLRKSNRFQTNFPLEYKCGTTDFLRIGQGVIRDINQTGILFRHQHPLRVEEVISLSAPLISGVLSEQKARVRNTRQSQDTSSGRYETGVEFLEVSPGNRNVIGNFIRARTTDRRRRRRKMVV